MKDTKDLKRKKLNYQMPKKFSKSARRAAKEHEYEGGLGTSRYLVRRSNDYLFHLLARILPFNEMRIKLHRKRGVKIGENVFIGPEVFIDETYPHYITLEDEVTIAPRAIIVAHSKPNVYHKDILEAFVAPLKIGKGTFIGMNAIILPGVNVGEGSIIGAGAVVTRDVPPHSFVAGVPAKVIKKLRPKKRKFD